MKIPHTLTEMGSTAPEAALPHPGKVTEISLKGTKKYQKNIYKKYRYNERQCENTSVPPLSVRVTKYIVPALNQSADKRRLSKVCVTVLHSISV